MKEMLNVPLVFYGGHFRYTHRRRLNVPGVRLVDKAQATLKIIQF